MASSRASEALQFDFPPSDDGEAETEGVAAEGNGPREERQPTRWEDEAEEWQTDDLDGFEAGSSADSALTVAEFYDRVKSALRMEFPAEVWVTGEIRKVSVNRGNRYLELADHDTPQGRGSTAMLDVACWSRDWPLIGAELKSVGLELAAGLVVRIRGRVGVWDGAAKLRFSMTDLDVAALLGGIAAARRKLLLALEAEGLLGANRRIAVPLVPMRIGLVTSAGSEAYRDFMGQLKRSSYRFDVRLEASAVQGPEAPPQIAAAIRRLNDFGPDVIVLVRGGGGRGDLAAFDSEHVARAIAMSRHPVWTGIGHTGDRSVADEVCQRALITPTGCGEAIVSAVTAYLEGIGEAAQIIASRCRIALDRAGDRVAESRSRLSAAARHELSQADGSLVLASNRAVHAAVIGLERNRSAVGGQAQQLARIARHSLQSEQQRVTNLKGMLAAFDPRRQLARGWSLTKSTDGRVVRSVAELAPADRIVTMFADGDVTSNVERISRIEETQ